MEVAGFDDSTIAVLVIPSSVTYESVTYDVTSIGINVFNGRAGLTSVTIPDSVTSIGDYAFSGCSGLTSLTMPIDIKVTQYTFYDCTNLTSVVLTKGQTGVGASYSSGYSDYRYTPWYQSRSNEISVTIEEGITSIGNSAFNGCAGLTSVTIPDSVTSIGVMAFRDCTGLTSVTIPDSVTSIGDYTFEGCAALKSVTIGNSVESIGVLAFYGCAALTSVTIPDSVTSIGNSAFRECTGLTSVTIGNSVESIGDNAFRECTGLTSVTIPDSVTSIGDNAFRDCTGLTSVTIGNSVTSIGDRAFEGCAGLKSVTIGNSVTSIGDNAFRDCTGLTSVTIPDSVTSIGNLAFYNCTGLTSLTIPSSVTSIGSSAFEGCAGLKSVTIPDSVTSIGNYAFYNCTGLTSMTIPSSVTSIGDYAFSGCSGLTSLTMPIDIKVTKYTFSYCTNLTSVVLTKGQTGVGASYSSGYGDYQYTPWYQSRSNEISVTIEEGITSIGSSAFYKCTGLTSVTIGNSVISIGSSAFYNCTGLTSVTIPDSVISIGNYAFHGCAGLTSVTIGNSVTSIGDRAFYNCTGLTSVTIPDSVTSIGDYAFHNCTGLTKFIVPEDNANYSSDENGILYNKNKTSLIQCPEGYEGGVVIPDSVTSIGDFAFYKCTGLTSVTIPDSVISIGDYAFYNCTGLTSIIIPGSVTDIGEQAFYNMVLCSEDGTTILGHTPGELSGHSFAGTYERMVRNGHTVTYEVDGGSSSAPTQPIIGKGQVFIIASYEGNKAGHTFAGWGEGDNVYETGDEYTVGDSDVVLTAIWDINQYTITWTVEGVTTDTQVLDYGATPVYAGVAPTKAADAQYTYAFSGWDPVISTVTGHQTYAAVFTETLRAYTITWTVEGVTTDTQVLDYGATPVYAGVAPTKAADAQYTYAFSGWDPVISTVTGHQTYAAVFTETLRAYTITWTVEGVTTDTQVLDYGATPVYAGVAPTKAADAQYTYAFSGWDPVISTVTGHQTYAAVFTETLRAYTITWTVEGVTTDTQVLDYGATPVYAGVAPTKAADAQYTYAFSGWDPVISTVTGHQTYAAVFTETLRAYTITWTVEGVTTDTQVLDYGATPVYAGVAPTKAADAQYTYAFSGWDPVISTVTGHQTYAAVFTETLRAYTITWSVDGVTTTTQADHGTMPAYAGTPAKAATPEYTYAFAGWTPGLVEATADTTYTAEFTATPVDYTITFDSDGGSAVGAMTVAFGAAVTAPTAPTKTGYAFSGWSPALPATMPAENRTVTAIWSVNQYTITFDSAGGTAVASMTQDYGTTVSAPAAPTKTGHTFTGWTPALPETMPAENRTVTATWTINQYTLTFSANGGTGSVPAAIKADYNSAVPLPEAGSLVRAGYTFGGWSHNTSGSTLLTPYTVKAVDETLYAVWNIVTYSELPSSAVISDIIGQDSKPVLQVTGNAVNGVLDNSLFENLGSKPLNVDVVDDEGQVQYSWTFDGEYKEGAGTFKAGISEVTPEDELSSAISSTGAENPLVLSFEASGELPINATLKYYVGAKYADGTKLTLFFYNEETKQLEVKEKDLVVTDGWVELSITHCSSYVLAEPAPASAPEDNIMLYAGIGLAAVAILGAVAFLIIRRR